MADKRIDELDSVSSFLGSEYIPLEQAGSAMKTTVAELKSHILDSDAVTEKCAIVTVTNNTASMSASEIAGLVSQKIPVLLKLAIAGSVENYKYVSLFSATASTATAANSSVTFRDVGNDGAITDYTISGTSNTVSVSTRNAVMTDSDSTVVSGHHLSVVDAPTSDSHVANKAYVDSMVSESESLVASVNGKTGDVTLTTEDIENTSGYVDEDEAAAVAPVQSVNGMTDDVELDYSAIPPSYDRKTAEIVRVANSYYDNRWIGNTNVPRFEYHWQNTYRDTACRLGYIDCSALAGLILRGLAYADSPYGKAYAGFQDQEHPENSIPPGNFGDWVGVKTNGRNYCQTPVDRDSDGDIDGSDWDQNLDPNFDPDSVVCSPAMSWAINPRDYWCLGNYKQDEDDGDSPGDADDEDPTAQIPSQGRPQSAANLAQLLITMGDVVPIDGGFDQIQPGDFLFWASRYETGEHAGEYKRKNRFLHISHIAVCTEVDAEGLHWYVDSMSTDYAPDNTIRKSCLETGIPKAEYLVLVIRLRQGRAWERLRILLPPLDATVSDGATQRFTCIAGGDCVRYRWQFSDDNGTTWVNSSLPHSSSIVVTVNANMDGRLYHCLCTDTHGRVATSRGAKITIV